MRGKTMDILSQETLTLLRDKNVRKTIDELIDQRETDSKTVELASTEKSSAANPARPATLVRIRRIA
jgi:hypothetical protein